MKRKASLCVLCAIFLSMFVSKLFHPDWKRNDYGSVLAWDNAGYYAYLPAVFIYSDLDSLSFAEPMNEKYPMAPALYMFQNSETGKRYIMYPSGLAILYTPFFLAAHVTAHVAGYPADGYSLPYKFFISWGTFVYAMLGLWVLRKVLLRLFSDKVTAITLLLLVAGTNYFLYASQYSYIVHIPNCFVLSLVLLYCFAWYEEPGVMNALVLGAALGLATLVRPTDGLILLIPLLWRIGNWQDVAVRLKFLWQNLASLLLVLLAAFAVGALQLIYWKYTTGKFLFFSYTGEWFDFTQPHLSDILFSYKKGWILYSPLVLLAFYGIYRFYRSKHPMFIPVAVYTAVSIYVLASWSNWWYGGGYGNRAFISLYPVLSLPFAFAVENILTMKARKRFVIMTITALFLVLSIFQTWQYDHYLNCMFRTTKESYWKAFFATSPEQADMTLLTPEYTDEEVQALDADGYTARTVGFMDYTEKKDSTTVPMVLTKELIYTRSYKEEFRYLTAKPGSWLRVTATVRAVQPEDLDHIALTVSFEDKKEKRLYKYFSKPLRTGTISGDSILEVTFRTAVSFNRFDNDLCKFYLYNFDNFPTRLEVYSLKVEMCDPKRKD
jgi:hypothetical protein